MVYVSAYLSFILEYLKQFKLCPKRPALPRPIKVQVLFELFGALYMYISDEYMAALVEANPDLSHDIDLFILKIEDNKVR